MRLVSVVFALSLLLTGCGRSSRMLVSRADAVAIAQADEALRGRVAEIALARPGDPARGRIEFVRPDSTAWTDEEAFWTVPTAGVYSITASDRWGGIGRGALIGAGVGAGFGALAIASAQAESGGDLDELDGLLAGTVLILAVPTGALYGAVGGAIAGGNDVEVTFVGPVPLVPPPAAGLAE